MTAQTAPAAPTLPFKYYIADPFDGAIRGTNNEEVANEYALCQDYFVVNALSGKALITKDGETAIEEDVKEANITR